MFFKHKNWVLCAAITFFLHGGCDQFFVKACTGFVHELTDVGRRGPLYVINSSSEPLISDSTLPTGWYVAKDDTRYYNMVNGTAPRFAYCGTDNPIYLKDNITKVDDGKEYDYKACLVDYDSNCKYQYNVKIRRCGQGIQYYLHPTDGISAYCFEPSSMAVEPAPNYRIPGSIIVSVALMYINTSNAFEPQLDFKCNFGSASNNFYYEVNWVVNERVEKTFQRVKVQDVDSTNLDENTLRMKGFSLGISIQCGVRISSSFTGKQTSIQMSERFYAGVKIQNPRIELKSGESANIILQPTVPLGCRRPHLLPPNREESCSVYVEMFDPNSYYSCKDTTVAAISNQKICGSTIDGWRNKDSRTCMNQHNVDMCSYNKLNLEGQSIRVSVTNDRLQYPDDKTFTLQLTTGSNGPHSFWENSRLDNVQILYEGNSKNLVWRNKHCSVVNDPTLETFDGGNKSSTYMKQFGTYMLYNNTQFDTEVQIKTQYCYADSTASCTCAAAIKAGGDVFVIDICNKVKRASFKHCQTDLLNVREITSHDYEIYFPTGTKVKVKVGAWSGSDFLSVYVYPSPVDPGNTVGLCGNLNGKNDELLTDSYFSHWSLKGSLFDVRIDLPSTWTYDHYVCFCPRVSKDVLSATVNPNGKDSRAWCFKEQFAACTESIVLQGEKKNCALIKKRSVVRHHRNINRLFSMPNLEKRYTHRKRKSIAKEPLSETEAYNECISFFQSKPVYDMRNDLPSDSLNESLSACVNDMMVDGQEFWKDASYNSWVSIIAQEIGRNLTVREEKENTVREFERITCPAQCNGNGDCLNGTCVCKNDFVGDSCFIKKSTPLELTDIEGGGECDLAYGEDCHECLQFHTVNLLKGFKCKINTQELDENGTIIMSDESKRVGEYENIFEGYCCPSAVETRRRRSVTTETFTVRYTISVSNDGVNFGPGKDVYVYDSTCQTYVMMGNGKWKCSLKNDTCYIDGGCYRNGTESIMNAALICCPLNAKYTWSSTQDCYGYGIQTKSTRENNITILVAVAISVSGILIVALLVVFAIWKYNGKKRYISSKELEPEKDQEPDYTNLYFGNSKSDVNGRAQFHQPDINVFVTDYEQLRK